MVYRSGSTSDAILRSACGRAAPSAGLSGELDVARSRSRAACS
jgi:hypothetical protein